MGLEAYGGHALDDLPARWWKACQPGAEIKRQAEARPCCLLSGQVENITVTRQGRLKQQLNRQQKREMLPGLPSLQIARGHKTTDPQG